MSKIVCITGGIGSGKTSVAKYFESLGIPVFIADEQAKDLYTKKEVADKIRALFGNDAFINEQVNRKHIAEIVFANPGMLKQLNEIIHPAVKVKFAEWLEQNQDAPIVIKESAILFETNSHVDCESVITVVAPLEERILRVTKRDNSSREEVLLRINNQMSDEQRISLTTFIINNVDWRKTIVQCNEIHKILSNQ